MVGGMGLTRMLRQVGAAVSHTFEAVTQRLYSPGVVQLTETTVSVLIFDPFRVHKKLVAPGGGSSV